MLTETNHPAKKAQVSRTSRSRRKISSDTFAILGKLWRRFIVLSLSTWGVRNGDITGTVKKESEVDRLVEILLPLDPTRDIILISALGTVGES